MWSMRMKLPDGRIKYFVKNGIDDQERIRRATVFISNKPGAEITNIGMDLVGSLVRCRGSPGAEGLADVIRKCGSEREVQRINRAMGEDGWPIRLIR